MEKLESSTVIKMGFEHTYLSVLEKYLECKYCEVNAMLSILNIR